MAASTSRSVIACSLLREALLPACGSCWLNEIIAAAEKAHQIQLKGGRNLDCKVWLNRLMKAFQQGKAVFDLRGYPVAVSTAEKFYCRPAYRGSLQETKIDTAAMSPASGFKWCKLVSFAPLKCWRLTVVPRADSDDGWQRIIILQVFSRGWLKCVSEQFSLHRGEPNRFL